MKDCFVVAVDFDDTITEPSSYPITGKIRSDAITVLKEFHNIGIKIILWTCRTDMYLEEAITLCSKNGIVLDAVNENIKDCKSRKVLADVYIDDKGLCDINWLRIRERTLNQYDIWLSSK